MAPATRQGLHTREVPRFCEASASSSCGLTAAVKLMIQGKLVGLLCPRVDDMPMAFGVENNEEFCDHVIQQLRGQ
eukprot:4324348-Pyramimonas_sp.AAC.1